MVQYVAHVAADLFGDQVVVIAAKTLEGEGQRADRAPHLDDLTLEQIDVFDIGGAGGGEDVLLHGVDVRLHQIGHPEVGVDDVVGDRVHHRVRPECAVGR